jgi:purine-binding chemotaxis protein CheW
VSAIGQERPKQLLTFRVAEEVFALPASMVREVTRLPRLTRVPYSPECLLGVGNLRGSVLPVVALGALVGLPISPSGRVIVLAQADPVGIFVDSISAVSNEAPGGVAASLLDLGPLLEKAFISHSAPQQPHRGVARISPHAIEARNEIDLLVFAVGSQEYALPVTQIEEVLRLPDDITTLPTDDDVVVGTVARKGGLLPLLSLQRLLGLTVANSRQGNRIIICRIGAELVGLVVDGIRSVMRVDEAVIDIVPDVLLRGQAEARIQAICRLDSGRRLVSILATSHLLNSELTSRLMQHRGDQEDVMPVEASDMGDQFLVFQLDGQDFGIPIEAVVEVTTPPAKLTRLPKTPDFVEGVMNLRGEIVAVVDQRRRFQGEASSGKRRRIIITTLGDMKIGFAVDFVAEVLRISQSSVSAAPNLGDNRTRVFDRIANIADGERIILLVDPRELLDRAEQDVIAAIDSAENAKHP